MKPIKFFAPVISALQRHQNKIARRLFAMGLALAGAGLLALAAPSAVAADVPFSLDGTFTFTYLRGTTIEVSGDGHASPGGNFVFLDTVQLEYGGEVVEGMITLTFASGSTLTFCYEAPIEQIDGVPVAEGPYWVVDGTGLFAGASGTGVIWYRIGQGAPFTMDGTLSR